MDRAKALEHEQEGARAIIDQAAIRERELLKQLQVNVRSATVEMNNTVKYCI